LIHGLAHELLLDLSGRILDGPGLAPYRAWDPVRGPHLIDDRAPDTRPRIGLELESPLGFEFLNRVDETEHPIRDEVGEFDRVGETHDEAGRHDGDERSVVDDESRPRVPGRPRPSFARGGSSEIGPPTVDLRRRRLGPGEDRVGLVLGLKLKKYCIEVRHDSP